MAAPAFCGVEPRVSTTAHHTPGRSAARAVVTSASTSRMSQPLTLNRSSLAGNVLVLTPLFFQALDEVLMDRRVQLRQERLIQVVRPNQEHDIPEVGVAPCRQFELDQ